ncbi:MAG TPA: cytochrome c peroxidase [Bacteroidales bacterium]|nr:cytochrome c peroxidase [Bacteroidales bacterium]
MKWTYLGLVLIPLVIVSCTKDDPEPEPQPTPYDLDIPPFFPSEVYIPDDNPLTVEGVKLGRYLFYDGRIAGRADEGKYMSCSSCHVQGNSFEVGMPRPAPVGLNGISTGHAMLPMINLIWNPGRIGWNGSVANIEDDVYIVISDPSEFGSTNEKVVAAIQSIPMYPPMFEAAFGTREVTVERIAKAIAQFVRTLISSNSKFDRYMRGEEQLTLEELNGYVLFSTEEGADCFHCHGGSGNPLFTTNLFYNNGKDDSFAGESDRYSVTGDETMKGAYKATTLRNIEFTGPYMHDGRFNTLDEVIDFYAHALKWSPYIDPLMHHISNGGNQLLPAEKAALKAFLKTLSDTSFLTDPRFSRPGDLPVFK